MTKATDNLLKIEDYTSKLTDMDKFHKDLLENLGDSLFHFESLHEIIYSSLKIISPVNKYLRNSDSSINKKCGEVLQYFGIKKVSKTGIRNVNTGEIKYNTEELKKSYTQRYLEIILRLKKPPKQEFDSLSIQSEKHLIKITDRVKYYSQEKVVSNFKENAQRPTNHQERTILDFYLRCIEEQDKIIDFIYYGGLKERALLKSRHFIVDMPFSFIYGFSDFPYVTSEEYSNELFDHSSINKSAHRIGDFPIKKGMQMEKLYRENKHKFYIEYFKRHSKKGIIQDIEFNLNTIPLSLDRIEFLEEIIYLFCRKRWVSFYGLALSQIEGLFSDMLEFLPKSFKARTLPNKVNSLRAFYSLSGYYFDYFQYHIPNLRNKFMHGQLDGSEKNKLNSYDFLLDIQFLLNTVKQLDSPYINLTQIVNNQGFQASSIEDISIMFELTKKLKPQQEKEIDSTLKEFYKSRFIDTKNLDYFLYGFDAYADKEINRIHDMFFKITGLIFEETKYDHLTKLLKEKEKIELFKDELIIEQTILQKLNNYYIFYKNYKKRFPKLPDDTKSLIQKVFQKRQTDLSKISYLAKQVLEI